MSVRIEKEKWQQLLNKKVEVIFDPEVSFEFELIEVFEGTPIKSVGIEPFSIILRGKPSLPVYIQDTYTVRADDLGEMQIFLIPRQPDREGIYYEAIFS